MVQGKIKGIDDSAIIAAVKDISMALPATKIQRQELIRKIAEGLTEKQGHFFFDEIFAILESIYKKEISDNEIQIINEIEEWVSDQRNAEHLGEEDGDHYYRIT